MSCEQFGPIMTAYLDGELPPAERERLERHLAACEGCARKLAELAALKEDLAMIRFKEPSDPELERYWSSIYNRLERGAGWILLSVGAIILLCYGAFRLVEGIIKDPKVAIVLKVGVVALVFGVVILFVSLLRERLAVRKVDKYSREVER
jgi:predicted anti-sigma-YlaC factor YlaD